MKKSWIASALMVSIAVTGFAGGQGEVSGEGDAIELHVFHFKVNIINQWNALTDIYTEENPDVVFNNEIRGGGAQWMTILKNKFAADAAPDIFIVEGPGQAVVFEEYLTDLSDEPWVDRAIPFARDGLRMGDAIMGMPVNLEGYGYIYNEALFEEAGIGELPRTFDELEETARALESAGHTAFGTGYGEWWVMGLHLVNAAFAMQPDPQAFVDGLNAGTESMAGNPLFADLQRLIDLNVRYGERNPLTTDNRMQVQFFVNRDVAMIQQGNWKELDIIAADPDMEFGVLPLPLTNDPEQANRIPIGVPFYFVVNGASPARDQEVAREFLNWLVSSETGQRFLVEEFGFIPAYSDIEGTGLGGVSRDLLAAAAEDRAIPWVFGRFPDGMPQEFANNIQAYIGGQQSWDETLEEFDAQWQRLSQ